MTRAQFDSLAAMSVEQLEAWRELHKEIENKVSLTIESLETAREEMTSVSQLVAALILYKTAGREDYADLLTQLE
jgi:hypothetical protein